MNCIIYSFNIRIHLVQCLLYIFNKNNNNNFFLYFLVNVFLLWWEYFTLKMRLDSTPEAQILSADACNEHVFFIFSIVYTLFSVS